MLCPKDLSAKEFKAALQLNHFHHDRLSNRFIDTTSGNWSERPFLHVYAGVRDARGRLKRQETLDKLLSERGDRHALMAAAEAERTEHARLAAAIAPVALPPARDALTGPAAIAALADDIIAISTRSEGAALPDLLRLGWRKSQVFEHADAARALAYSRQGGVAA